MSGYSVENAKDDANNFAQSVNDDMAGSLSTFIEKVKTEPLDEAGRLKALADFYEQEYRDIAVKADKFTNLGIATGDPSREKVWADTASQIREWANERATMSDKAWLETLQSKALGKVAGAFAPVGDAIDVTQLTTAVAVGDWDRVGEKSSSILGSIGGYALAGAAIAALPFELGALVVGGIIAGFAYVGGEFASKLWKTFAPWIHDGINNLFTSAYWHQLYGGVQVLYSFGPIVLDMDNSAVFNPSTFVVTDNGIDLLYEREHGVMFDHDGDGVLTSMTWISPNDGFLVRDINGNGLCSGLIAPDTLIRDNYYQLLRCHNESETNIQTVF